MATVNIYDMTDTWNDGATTFAGIKMDVTNTASAAASKLLDLQVGSSKIFDVSPAGEVNIYNTYTDASNYERLSIKWDTNVATIAAEAAGTGEKRALLLTSANDIVLHCGYQTPAGTKKIQFKVNNVVMAELANSFLWDFTSQLTRVRFYAQAQFYSVVTMSNLPTTDPVEANRLWNDSGTLKISAG